MRPSRTLTGLSRPQVVMLQFVLLLGTLVAFASSLALPDNAANTVLHDDAAIDAAPRGALQNRRSGMKIMIVGDSISQGENGDYTWRYRIWQWMQSQGVSVQFVGPWVGTMGHGDPQPPQPPPLQGQSAPTVPVDTNGDYADDVDTADWNPHHLSKWGWQCAQAKDVIQEMVSTYQPDMLLVELGFNDIGWFISDAEGTAVSMSLFISNARAANSNIKIALANIPQRTSLGAWRADLPVKTTAYNTALPELIQSWTTSQSPIYLVDFAGNYDCHVDDCPAGYDGLHPNTLGEYQIAQAFSETLVSSFGIGSNPLQIPALIPVRPAPVPTNVVAAGSPVGVTVTWDKVHSARTYEVRSRLAGAGNWTVADTDVNGYYTTWCVDGQQWEYQVRTRNIDQGSDWSDIVSAQCATQAPGQVTNVYTEPSLLGMTVSWDPPTERGDGVNLYQIITLDTDVAGAYVQTFGVTDTRAFVQDLTPGHHYVVSVVAWSSIGGGFPQGGLAVVPGYTDPPPTPSNLMLTSIDGTTMQFSWCGDPSAAGYRYWVRSVGNDSAEYSVTPFTGATTTDTVYFLFPGVWTYEYCVDAMNGNLTSGRSQCIQGAQPPNSIGGPVGSGAGCYQCLAEPCNVNTSALIRRIV